MASSECKSNTARTSNDKIKILDTGRGQSAEDRELWDAFRSGDEGAFIRIYKRFVDVLFNYGCQICNDKELIKDCLQDFFIYLRGKRTGLGETDSIKFYLLKSFRRKIIDSLKKYHRELEKNKALGFVEFPVQLSHEHIFINQQFEKEQLAQLEQGLNSLDTKEKEAIYYFYYEHLSYEQIAGILGFTHVSSARRLIYRAIGHLRKYLTKLGSLVIFLISFFNYLDR